MHRVLTCALVALAVLASSDDASAQRRLRRQARPPATTAPATATPTPTPTGRVSVAQIAVGGDHSCARTTDGRVLCWGNDVILTLMFPRTSILGPRATPTPLARVHDARTLDMHGSQPIVRLVGDRLVSGGTWDIQRLGTIDHSPEDWRTDTLELASVPAQVLVASAMGSTICSIDPRGALRCRGDNQFGQLGAASDVLATEDWLSVPLANVVSASHGGPSGCAITRDGAIHCFGRGLRGALGDGASTERASTPVRVAGIPSARAVAVSREGHACAIATDGSVSCWGHARYGQLGSTPYDDTSTPRRVQLPAAATRIAVGRFFSCAIVSAEVHCWGAGNEGQLGDGRSQGSAIPVLVSGLDRVTDLSLGDAHACALRDDGTAWCWGRNTEGSCGVATGTDTSVPVRVTFP